MFKTSLSAADAQQLLANFAPVIYLHGEEEFFPCSVEWYLARVTMQYKTLVSTQQGGVAEVMASIADTVTDSNLNTQSYSSGGVTVSSGLSDPNVRIETDFYLPITDTDATRPGMNQVSQGALVTPPPVYGAVLDGPVTSGSTPAYYDLLYGFFYAYNGAAMNDPGFFDIHEGDWEHIVVRVKSDSDMQTVTVLGAYYQAHRSIDPYSQWYFPPGTEVGNVFQYFGSTTRPIVYSALYGHSSYVAAGDYYYNWYRGTDVTQGAGQGILWDGQVEMIDPSTQSWLLYSGFWGGDIFSVSGSPPTGPLMQGWFNSRTDGPAESTLVSVSRAAAKGQSSRVSPTSDFTLNIPDYVQWSVLIENPVTAAGIVFNISEDVSGQDKRVLTNIKNGMVTPGRNKYTSKLYVSSLRYVTPEKTYQFTDVFTAIGLDGFNVSIAVVPYQHLLRQTATAITNAQAPNYMAFGVGAYQADGQADLFAVQTENTESSNVEVNVFSAASQYRTLVKNIVTPIALTDATNFAAFVFAGHDDVDLPELYGIRTQNTQSGMMEVWILDGSSGYQSFLLQAPTPIACADAANFNTWSVSEFDDEDDGYPALIGVRTANTGSGNVEVWALDGAASYNHFAQQAPTLIPLGDVANYCAFAIGDYDGDGTPDLFALAAKTHSGKMEVNVLDGGPGYQAWLLQNAPTPIASSQITAAGDEMSWIVSDANGDGNPDIFALFPGAKGGPLMLDVLNGQQVT